MIKLTHSEWMAAQTRISTDHGQSMVLVRSKMQRELGFTPRHHRDYNNAVDCIFLDFYDDAAETMFRLRYL